MHREITQYKEVKMMQPGVVVAAAPQSTMNVKAVQSLGIVQIIFGVLSVVFGIGGAAGTSAMWVSSSGTGIWFGVWIIVTGIIGFFSARQPQNRCLGGTNMGFSIVCSIISFFNFISCALAVAFFSQCQKFKIISVPTYVDYSYSYNYNYSAYYYYYYYNVGDSLCKNKDAGMAIYSILMILMMAEFAVSLAISIFCCKSICCRNGFNVSCCPTSQGTTPPPVAYQTATTNAAGQTVIVTNTGYPQGPYPGTVVPSTNSYPSYPVQGKAVSKPGVVLQPGMIQQGYPQQQGMTAQPGMAQQGYPQQQGMTMQPGMAQQGMAQRGYPHQQGMTMQPLTVQQGYPIQQQTKPSLRPPSYVPPVPDKESDTNLTYQNTADLNKQIGEENPTYQNSSDFK